MCFAPFLCAEPAIRNESLTELLIKTAAGTRSRTATAEVFYTEMISEPQELSATLKSVLGVKNFTFKEWLQCLCQVQQLEGASDPSAPLPAAAH